MKRRCLKKTLAMSTAFFVSPLVTPATTFKMSQILGAVGGVVRLFVYSKASLLISSN